MIKQQTTIIVLTDDKNCSQSDFGNLSTDIRFNANLFENLNALKAALVDLGNNQPVIFVSKNSPYSASKLKFIPDFWTLYNGRSFGFFRLMFDQTKGCLTINNPYFLLDANLTLLLHLFYACFNSSDLKKLLSEKPGLEQIFDTRLFPGIFHCLPEALEHQWAKTALNHLKQPLNSQYQKHLQTNTPGNPEELNYCLNRASEDVQALYKKNVLNKIEHQLEELKFFSTHGRLKTSFDFLWDENGVLCLTRNGNEDTVSKALKKYFSMSFKCGPPSESDFLKLLQLTQRVNSASEVIAETRSLSKQLLLEKPDLINAWFRFVVLAADVKDFNNLTDELTDNAVRKVNYEALQRINKALKEYGSIDQHLSFVEKAKSSSCQSLLLEKEFCATVVDRYLGDPDLQIRLNQLFDAEQIDYCQSIDSRLIRGCLSQDRGLVITGLEELFGAIAEVDEVLTKLVPYSNELAQLKITINDISLPKPINRRQAYILATLLKDNSYLLAEPAADYGAHISAVACSQDNDYSALSSLLLQLSDGKNLKHPNISGQSIHEVFNSLKQPDLAMSCDKDFGKVSVIMTALNPDIELLKLSLDSIANQSYKNMEIVFVDDCSDYDQKADMQSLVESYKNIIYIDNEINTGPYLCRNKALEAASGDFIAIQDADDFSHPQRFERQLKALADNAQIQLVASQHVRIDSYGTIQFEAGFSALGDGTMSSMYRKSVFSEIGPFIAVRSRGDVEMRQRIINHYGRLAYTELDYPLVYCYAGANTLSQSTARNMRGALSVFRGAIESAYGCPERYSEQPQVPSSLRAQALMVESAQ